MVVVLGWTLACSLVCFGLYVLDKRAAGKGAGDRVSEASLLALGLVGGWPGGWVAQQLFRHKTRKTSFQVKFWITVLIHMVVVWNILNLPMGVKQ